MARRVTSSPTSAALRRSRVSGSTTNRTRTADRCMGSNCTRSCASRAATALGFHDERAIAAQSWSRAACGCTVVTPGGATTRSPSGTRKRYEIIRTDRLDRFEDDKPASKPVADALQRQCPRQESNLCTRFRKPLLYPLSYGGAGEV